MRRLPCDRNRRHRASYVIWMRKRIGFDANLIAQPEARWDAQLRIDGRTVELKKAYSAVRAAPRTFVGFYADLSMLDADRAYRFELELPKLAPGQLQGVFFENVETEYSKPDVSALPRPRE